MLGLLACSGHAWRAELRGRAEAGGDRSWATRLVALAASACPEVASAALGALCRGLGHEHCRACLLAAIAAAAAATAAAAAAVTATAAAAAAAAAATISVAGPGPSAAAREAGDPALAAACAGCRLAAAGGAETGGATGATRASEGGQDGVEAGEAGRSQAMMELMRARLAPDLRAKVLAFLPPAPTAPMPAPPPELPIELYYRWLHRTAMRGRPTHPLRPLPRILRTPRHAPALMRAGSTLRSTAASAALVRPT